MLGLGPIEVMIILFILSIVGIGLISMGQKAAAKEQAEAEPDDTSSRLSQRFHGHPGNDSSFPTSAAAKYCERCGNSIEDPKAFCPFCGVEL